MARVNVEQKALTDYRIATLGHLLGGDHRLGLGHMVYVWNACQERESYTLSERDLIVISGIEHFASALLESGLGKKVKGGRIEVKGTRGRIEWLAKARDNGSKGGRPRKPDGSHNGLTTGLPSGFSENNPPAPVPVLVTGDSGNGVPVEPLPVPPSSEQADRKSARPSKGKTKLPDKWYPPEPVIERIKQECPGVNLRHEHAKFVDWATSNGRMMADWSAAWRNWMRRAYERVTPNAPAKKQFTFLRKPE